MRSVFVGRLTVTVLAGVFVAALAPAPGHAATPGPDIAPPADADGTVVPDSYIVTLKAVADPEGQAIGLAKAAGGEVGHVYEHALHGFVFKGSAKAAAALARNPNVRTVVPNRTIKVMVETTPPGIKRIRANHPTQPDAHDSGFTGEGVRVAILDTGVDLAHPDLVANIDAGLGMNCIGAGPPQDGHGHGTHVAGIVAASEGNDLGVIGVAPAARLVPFKVLDDTGYGEWSNLICAIDILTGYATDADPANDVSVANMSLGDVGTIGSCDDGGVREAICTSVAVGITYVAAAGNSTVDASTFIPAAFPEVIAVSAMTDLDGEPGGLGGCVFWIFYCDDTLAEFSNYGSIVDVTAPGTQVHSTWINGGYNTIDGTSMASPHVAGVVALVRAANPALAPADVDELLKVRGECPNGAWADADGSGDCMGKGQRTNDPDGYGEPLVSALRAAQAAAGWDAKPTIQITSPSDGSAVSGIVNVTATANDDDAVTEVAFAVNGVHVSTDVNGSDGWSVAWDTSPLLGGVYTVSATATDTQGQTTSNQISVTTGANQQGDWVGTYGQDGYALLGWNSSSDLVNLPQVTLTLDQGERFSWASSTTEERAVESPSETERRATAWYHDTQLRLHLAFDAAYTGTLHLYALDWSSGNRRQSVTVNDAAGAQQVTLSTDFVDGAWLHFPITVVAGGQISITADWLGGPTGFNAVLSGLFLGDGGSPPPPTPPGTPNLSAAADVGSVNLSWGSPSSDGGSPIASYNIYRGSSPGGQALLTTVGNVLAYVDNTVTGGTTYYYRTSAVNAVGEGALSNESRATVPEIPGQQGDWVGTYGQDGYALLGWNSSSDLVNLPQVTLTLDQGERFSWASSTTEERAVESPSETERRATAWYHDTQLRLHLAFDAAYTGTLHLYALDWSSGNRRQSVTVNDAAGAQQVTLSTDFVDGAWLHFPITVVAGGQISITADWLGGPTGFNAVLSGLFLGDGGSPLGAPGAPGLVSAMSGDGQVTLNWTAPALDGGSPITGYTASASPGGAGCATPNLSCTVTGLTNGTEYDFSVTASNALGDSERSNSISATPIGVPGAPSGMTAVPGNAQVALAWSPPASDGGSPILGYIVTATPGGTTCETDALGCTIDGLTNGTTYSFTVSATNAVGTGPASTPASATPTTAPDAPSLVSATPGNGQVTLDWTAPPSDGGSPITGYVAIASPGGATCSTEGLSCTVMELANGTQYSFTVTAANAVGNGPASNSLSATPIALTAPSAPTGLNATPGNAQVALNWTAPTSDGGSPVTGYRIYRGIAAGAESLLTTVGDVSSYLDSGVTNGTTYFYQVTALNAAGEGDRSNEVSAKPATVPGAPRNLSAKPHKVQGVELKWSAPTSNGGSAITGYRIYRSTTSGATTFLIAVGNVTSFRDTATVKGVRYYYRTTAVNAVGEGPFSSQASAVAK